MEFLTYCLKVAPYLVDDAANFYINTFGAVKKNSYCSRIRNDEAFLADEYIVYNIELTLGDTTNIMVCGDDNSNSESEIFVALNSIDMFNIMYADLPSGAQSLFVTHSDSTRGIVRKVLDPFGFTWSFCQKTETETATEVVPRRCQLCHTDYEYDHQFPLCTADETMNLLNSVNFNKHAFESSLATYGVTRRCKTLEKYHTYFIDEDVVHYMEPYNGYPDLRSYLRQFDRYLAVLRWTVLAFENIYGMKDRRTTEKFEDSLESFDKLLRRLDLLYRPRNEWINPTNARKDAIEILGGLLSALRTRSVTAIRPPQPGLVRHLGNEEQFWNRRT
uniref:Uncharacterized protein n=1 Tax=Noccaea caerulescens TaxID=107243 RepID=A0A1J3F1U9_NOCCA